MLHTASLHACQVVLVMTYLADYVGSALILTEPIELVSINSQWPIHDLYLRATLLWSFPDNSKIAK